MAGLSVAHSQHEEMQLSPGNQGYTIGSEPRGVLYSGAAEVYLLASSNLELEFPTTSAPAQVEFSMPQYHFLAYYSSLVEAVASIL